jgi:hypothetical protein
MRQIRLRGLFSDNRFVDCVFWQDTAGQIEVVKRLFVSHPWAPGKNQLRFRLDLRDLPLGV